MNFSYSNKFNFDGITSLNDKKNSSISVTNITDHYEEIDYSNANYSDDVEKLPNSEQTLLKKLNLPKKGIKLATSALTKAKPIANLLKNVSFGNDVATKGTSSAVGKTIELVAVGLLLEDKSMSKIVTKDNGVIIGGEFVKGVSKELLDSQLKKSFPAIKSDEFFKNRELRSFLQEKQILPSGASNGAYKNIMKKGISEDWFNKSVKQINDNKADIAVEKAIKKAQTSGNELSDEAIQQIRSEASKMTSEEIALRSTALKSFYMAEARQASINMAGSCVIAYGTTVATNVIVGLINGKGLGESVKDAKLGSTALTTVYSTVFGIAFEKMFTFAGPAAQKWAKTIGSSVGSIVGDFWVNAFDSNETWCAVAACATLAGAIGGIWAGAAIAAAISASVPVAGWIVGGAIIVGATIATGITWLAYKLFG